MGQRLDHGAILSAAAVPFTLAILGARWLPVTGVLAVLGVWAALRPVHFVVAWLLNPIGESRLLAAIAATVLVPVRVGARGSGRAPRLVAVARVTLGDILLSLVACALFVQRRGASPWASNGAGPRWRASTASTTTIYRT